MAKISKLEKAIADRAPDQGNIIDLIDDETLVDLGKHVVQTYKLDEDTLVDWHELRKQWLELFMQVTHPKDFPWPNASNVPVPILTTAIIQFQSRAYEALMPAKGKVKIDKTGSEDANRAERVTRHMNFQIDHVMDDYEESWDVSLFQLAVNGSIFRKTYYDPVMEKPASKYCAIDDVVVNYQTSPMGTPERISHKIRLFPREIEIRKELGVFQNLEDIEYQTGEDKGKIMEGEGQVVDGINTEIRDAMDKAEGMTAPNTDMAEGDEAPRLFIEQQMWYDLDKSGISQPYLVTVDKETETVCRITKRLLDDTDEVINYWTHFYFFPNPEGFYGLGFGHILRGINHAAKAILDQIIDAGTMANLSGKTGFINGRSGIKKGDFQLSLGDYKRIDVNSDDIRKAIYDFQFDGPSTVLFSVLELLQNYAEKVTTVSETLTGELPSSDTSATAMVNAIEQGMKVFSTIHKRIHRTYKKELQKIYTINRMYPKPAKYNAILGELLIAKHEEEDGRAVNMVLDYAPGVDIQPVSDPNITSRAEKVAIAETVLKTGLSNPDQAENEQSRYNMYFDFYEALGVDDVGRIYQPPQPPPDLPQLEENAMFMREEAINALETQMHLEHLDVMEAFEDSPFFDQLTPRGKNLFLMHKQQHRSHQYKLEAESGRSLKVENT